MEKRESGPSTFFSHCANDAWATTHVAQKCPACDVQVLIHTACLRAFCFCVMIGTNALESFNGSIAALVTKKNDFYASHVGWAQLAILKRSFPGGYAALVELLRHRLELAPLTDQARIAAARHINKANHTGAGETVCSEAKLQELDTKKTRPKGRQQQNSKGKRRCAQNGECCTAFLSRERPRSIQREWCCQERRAITRRGILLRRKRQQTQEDGEGIHGDHGTPSKEKTSGR